jgi:excinuclease ABC subunit A
LLGVLKRLVESGNTVVVIEHNLDVIKSSDWVIDMGPEGGFRGGTVVAEGTPEEVARVKESYTGQFLAEILASNRAVAAPAKKTPAKSSAAKKK